ncbi:MAG TPA: cytochrome b N-terminal domain-containing protein, partial [Lacipirellulaceae bacterium]|nr:cytochrome b N-terminal domain-containing protein [Lacipirellulaceae bacterium]
DGAYRAPREINFWLGLILLQIVLGLALTGYLLPWDQKGFWATKVATNMIALLPVVGEPLQRLVVGASDYGHHTLTRFFALHAGVLPILLATFLTLHVLLFRRHGLTVRDPKHAPDTYFWPEQVLRDAVACLGVAIVVLVLVLWHYPHANPEIPLAQQLGAELGAPANPAESYAAARPETYFLFLFQSLKYLEVFPPIVGAIIVPGLVLFSLFLMPFIGRWQLGHRFNIVWTFALLIGAGILTALAWHEDHNGKTQESQHYLAAVASAESEAERAVTLADSPQGIPPTGALSLLRSDPKTQGPKLFRQHCAACHSHAPDSQDAAADLSQIINVEKPTASNLWNFGTLDWARGILDPAKIVGPHYFGNTKFKDGDMAKFVKENIGDKLAELKGDAQTKFRQSIEDAALAVTAENGRKIAGVAEVDKHVDAGRKAIVDVFACIDCHKFGKEGDIGMAPDLTGYAAREWLTAFLSNPADERFYRDTNDRMPAFATHPNDPANRLSPEDLATLVSWLRGEWYEPAKESGVK